MSEEAVSNGAKMRLAENVKMVPIELLDIAEWNPNVMSEQEFSALFRNIEEVGFVDPIQVQEEGERFKVVGGAHRLEVGKLLNLTEIPCVVLPEGYLSEDDRKFQAVKLNVIHGKMDAQKFLELYNDVAERHSGAELQSLFGFTDEKAFQKLLNATKSNLPDEMKEQFEKEKAKIKTLDDLANVLNRLFTEHGDEIRTARFMVFSLEAGGTENVIWCRCSKQTFAAARLLAEGSSEGDTFDDRMARIIERYLLETAVNAP